MFTNTELLRVMSSSLFVFSLVMLFLGKDINKVLIHPTVGIILLVLTLGTFILSFLMGKK